MGRSFLRRALRALATPMGSSGKRKTPRLLRGVMRFAESPRKRSQAEPSRIQRQRPEILPRPFGRLVAEIQADRALGITRRAGGLVTKRPSLRSNVQPS